MTELLLLGVMHITAKVLIPRLTLHVSILE